MNSYSDGSTVSGWRGFVIAGVLAASCAAAQAHAEVLLDTFGPGNSTIGLNLGVFNNGQAGYFSQAVAFSTPSTVTVDAILDRKSTRLNSSHVALSRMPSSA